MGSYGGAGPPEAWPVGAERRVTTQILFDSLVVPSLMLDGGGTIFAVNAAWRESARVGGMTDADLGVGTNYLDLCTGVRDEGAQHAKAVAEGLRAVLAGRRASFVHIYPCPDAHGRPCWYELLAGPLRDGHAVLGALVQHLDLTRRDSPSLAALTPRETVILSGIVEGLSNKGIARREGISESAVKFHLHKIYPKLGVANRAQAAQVGERLMIAGCAPAPQG